ncbi:MAG TPA: outer membrane beta-barrel domain-containing protein, partial [Myxococcaceae bacterium]|nr:outer membrane beta-barrel domain-containing protein [Myxococcaceae bacterium]
ESFLHFDLYGLAGPAFVQYAGPTANGVGSENKNAFGANVGVGLRFFANRWLAVRTELRDLVYQEKLQTGESSLRGQVMINLGLSIFFPLNFSEK